MHPRKNLQLLIICVASVLVVAALGLVSEVVASSVRISWPAWRWLGWALLAALIVLLAAIEYLRKRMEYRMPEGQDSESTANGGDTAARRSTAGRNPTVGAARTGDGIRIKIKNQPVGDANSRTVVALGITLGVVAMVAVVQQDPAFLPTAGA